ncbi:MAG: hypothetical protein AABY22_10515, partial [Nanoarchaeota archaeon]
MVTYDNMDQLNKEILQKIHSYGDQNEKYYFKISFECHYCKARLTNKNLMDLGEYESNCTAYYKVRCLKCHKRYYIENKKDNPINKLNKKNTKIKV